MSNRVRESLSRHRPALVTGAWVAVNLLLVAFGTLWVGLAEALESECHSPGCDDWATVDFCAIAAGVATMPVAALWRSRRRWLLGLASLLLCVPIYHALFV